MMTSIGPTGPAINAKPTGPASHDDRMDASDGEPAALGAGRGGDFCTHSLRLDHALSQDGPTSQWTDPTPRAQ
jgi:hypothetical protein